MKQKAEEMRKLAEGKRAQLQEVSSVREQDRRDARQLALETHGPAAGEWLTNLLVDFAESAASERGSMAVEVEIELDWSGRCTIGEAYDPTKIAIEYAVAKRQFELLFDWNIESVLGGPGGVSSWKKITLTEYGRQALASLRALGFEVVEGKLSSLHHHHVHDMTSFYWRIQIGW